MTAASTDLYAFLLSAVRGISSDETKVHINVLESPPHTTTLIIQCAKKDAKFIQSKLREIKIIAIAIAQRHKAIVNIVIDD